MTTQVNDPTLITKIDESVKSLCSFLAQLPSMILFDMYDLHFQMILKGLHLAALCNKLFKLFTI